MTRDAFEILSAKVLAQEATSDEVTRLEAALAEDAQLASDFAELRATWGILTEFGPTTEATGEKPATPPRHRIQRWEESLARHHGGTVAENCPQTILPRIPRGAGRPRRWPLAAAASIVLAITAITLWLRAPANRSLAPVVAFLIHHEGAAQVGGKNITAGDVLPLRGTDSVRLAPQATVTLISSNGAFNLKGPLAFNASSQAAPPRGTALETNVATGSIHTALFSPPPQTLGLLVTTRSGNGIRVYSPAGFTANLTPPILWKSQRGKTYDIAITDELTPGLPPMRGAALTSPVYFTNAWPGRTLTNDSLYRLSISESGNPFSATEVIFRVGGTSIGGTSFASPTNNFVLTTEKLLLAYQILTTAPSHLGDALAVLLTLPPDLANSEMALRLKLFAFGQLGFQEDFNATLSQLQSTPLPRKRSTPETF